MPCWKDISPRMAVAYDVFGNGRTATQGQRRPIRGGRHLHAGARQQPGDPGGAERDADLDRQQQQLRARLRSGESGAQNLSASGGDVCGALNNVNFGKNNPNATTYLARHADRIRGPLAQLADARSPFDQQLRHNISLGVGYFRTVWGGFCGHPEHRGETRGWSTSIRTASRRRPMRGCPAAAAIRFAMSTTWCRASSARRRPSSHGRRRRTAIRREVYNGFDVVLNIRLPRRININGGLNTGRTVTNNCGLTLDQPAVRKRQHAAHRGLLRDRAAMVGVDAGQVLRRVPAALRFPGRDDLPESARHHVRRQRHVHQCAGCTVARPQPVGGAERHRHDSADRPEHALRRSHPADRFPILTDVPRSANTRIEPQFDIYNAFNASPILAVNNTYGSAWRTPTQILAGRLLKFGMQVTF